MYLFYIYNSLFVKCFGDFFRYKLSLHKVVCFKNNNIFICFSQTEEYFIIQIIGDKFQSLDHHQAIFT
jgi:hypothetical protein